VRADALAACAAALLVTVVTARARAEDEEAHLAQDAPRDPLVFVADPRMGVETTVRSIDSLSRVVFRYEDALGNLDLRLDERRPMDKTVGVVGRSLQLVFVDEPLAEITSLASHEVGGHGARARELDIDVSYRFTLPLVYRALFSPKDEERATGMVEFLPGPPVEGDRAAVVTVGGLEANAVQAWWINARVVRSGGVARASDLLVYGASKLPYFDALLSVPNDQEDGNDAAAYVTGLQDRSNQWSAEDRRRISGRIGAAYLWNLFDPTLLYAAYGTLYEFLWRGERASRMPLPTIDGTTVFLSPRFALSPFGAEHALDLFLARGERMLDVYARVVSTGIWDAYGAGARVLGLRALDVLSIGAELDVWRAPEILLGERAVYDRPSRLGVNGGAFGDLTIGRGVGLTGKLAAKTSGFVLGQPIAAGIHGYLGLRLDWR